ncbi:Cytoplasmic tRNA 2-thiolation protein 2 [Coniosporium tulheliwenetii]|uniref:Cytoplasmic tRNA 2-thiolation protein 2 n=1 Tax=Coniosporium tulheliwenetii TaxID=3383036 RepID=A0ACC2YRF1_9PEZI|nr:Cytoplasmic tRNA 2-thiolation protein 2 [Cladosporium sp. JES 115]
MPGLFHEQENTGRKGFALCVLHVDTSTVEKDHSAVGQLEQLKERYPGHVYSSVPLVDVFTGKDIEEALEKLPVAHISEQEGPSMSNQSKLDELIASLASASSRADVISILRTKLIIRMAQKYDCEGILWGDSTTRLAEKTLAETAKGRGFSLPWQVSDGPSPYGITFNYPLRELLRKELLAHANMVSPSLTSLVVSQSATTQASTSVRNTTIDDLMKQYFESVEENYPSIVANVVRTSTKLEAPSAQATDKICRLCSLSVPDGLFGIHGWGGDQQEAMSDSTDEPARGLCYGCTRSMPQSVSSLP